MQRLLPFLAALSGCGALPYDTEGTLDRIAARRVVRVGVVAGGGDARATAALMARVSAAAGARAVTTTGAGEPLLAALDEDRLDVVIGPFASDTPWRPLVTLAPPIARQTVGAREILVRAAVRNGENRWATLVERASRAVAPALVHAG